MPYQTRGQNDPSAKWLATDLAQADDWIYALDADAGRQLAASVKAAAVPGKPLLAYRREDFELGPARAALDAAFRQAKHGRGIALVKQLPRHLLTPTEYELLTWAVGLHQGVARPQGRASQYISRVTDAGTDYRSASGRGYSSKSELEYHTDRADVIVLACYNDALRGGESLAASSLAAHAVMAEAHPQLVGHLRRPVQFSRQSDARSHEAATYAHPVVDVADDRLFVRWNRNRFLSAQRLPGISPLEPDHRAALDAFDAILHRPDIGYRMRLEPGDLQILNGHVTLHARTHYEDHPDEARKRLLFRLWLSTPDSHRLPDSWSGIYQDLEQGAVRGGVIGLNYDSECKAFDRRQAAAHGMKYDESLHD